MAYKAKDSRPKFPDLTVRINQSVHCVGQIHNFDYSTGVDITLPSASCTNNYKPLNIICGTLNCCSILNFGCLCGACIDVQKALCST